MSLRIERTDSMNPDFVGLVKKLDADLAIRDGAEHSFYSQFNKIDNIRHVVVVYAAGRPVGCGAMKKFAEDAMEVKRMFVEPDTRRGGVATAILREIEAWAAELGYRRCILETGRRQPEAIALYIRNGYLTITNYGQYANLENSVCFEKWLTRNRPSPVPH